MDATGYVGGNPAPLSQLARAAGLMQASFYFGYMLMVCYGEPKEKKGACGDLGFGGVGGVDGATAAQVSRSRCCAARCALLLGLISNPPPPPSPDTQASSSCLGLWASAPRCHLCGTSTRPSSANEHTHAPPPPRDAQAPAAATAAAAGAATTPVASVLPQRRCSHPFDFYLSSVPALYGATARLPAPVRHRCLCPCCAACAAAGSRRRRRRKSNMMLCSPHLVFLLFSLCDLQQPLCRMARERRGAVAEGVGRGSTEGGKHEDERSEESRKSELGKGGRTVQNKGCDNVSPQRAGSKAAPQAAAAKRLRARAAQQPRRHA